MYHKSHSRLDLLNIIKIFKLPIEDAEDFNKKQITEKLIKCLGEVDNIQEDNHHLGIKTLNDLKEYLLKPNQKKILSIKDKNEIMKITKLIINYCKNGYNVDISYFNTMDEIYVEARRLSQFGDIPSVRRMCQLLNLNPHTSERIYAVISQKVQNDLRIKAITTRKVHNVLTIKHGKVVVTFD
tara:strand:- start:3231 stop:3779 length:549 start_codon:yes stop_codon:yes gene_type:complete